MSEAVSAEHAPNNRVLIADDDPAFVRALSYRCKKIGLEIETAENGLQAILKAKRNPPRLLIVDLNMPEADGFQVCEWLLDSRRPGMDVILLTGGSDLNILDRCDSFGAFYVAKNQETWASIKEILLDVLHLDPTAVHQAEGVSRVPTDSALSKKRNKVLIVEDDPDMSRALEHRLRKCGAETMTASNGIDGYRMAAKELPDLVLADYSMPEGGGHYLIWRMRSTASTQNIPILVITGQRFEKGAEFSADREMTGRNGAVKVFYKPLQIDKLFEEISRHCTLELSIPAVRN